MSDATDFVSAFAQLKRLVQPDAAPVLTYGNGSAYDSTKELDQILENNKRATTFLINTAYSINQVVMPSTRDGRRYIVTVAGTSAATEPTWSTGRESITTSGTVTFEEAGEQYANIYDVRAAAFEAWDLKAAKASQFIAAGNLNFSGVFRQVTQMRDRFAPVVIV